MGGWRPLLDQWAATFPPPLGGQGVARRRRPFEPGARIEQRVVTHDHRAVFELVGQNADPGPIRRRQGLGQHVALRRQLAPKLPGQSLP